MAEQLTDELLAYNLQQGDSEALSHLLERHYSFLKGYLYRMTNGQLMLCEDLVQEAFLNVLRHIQKYEYPRPFKPWLYAIASNLARNHFRRADMRHAIEMEEEDWQMIADEIEQPDAQLVLAYEVETVVEALHALPYTQREVIILRYLQELSLNEIAETLDIPLGTVKSRLNVGLRRLRQGVKA